MPHLRRHLSAPDEIQRLLTLEEGEHLLADVHQPHGSWWIATSHAMHQLDVEIGDRRRDWCQVDSASVDKDSGVLQITWVDGTGTSTIPLRSKKDNGLAQVVRERVLASIVQSRTLAFPAGKVRVAVRRLPDGTMFSQVVGLGPVTLDDPEVAQKVDSMEAELREECGLPLQAC